MAETDPTNSLLKNPPPQDKVEKSSKFVEKKYDQDEKVCNPQAERQDSKTLNFDCTSEEATSSQKESSCHERKKKLFPISRLRQEFTKARMNIPSSLNIPSSMKKLMVSNREKQSVRQYYAKPQANPAPNQNKFMANYKYPKKRNTLTFGLMTANDDNEKTDLAMSDSGSSTDGSSSDSSSETESTYLEDSLDLETIDVIHKRRKAVRRRIRHKYSKENDEESDQLDEELEESLYDHTETSFKIGNEDSDGSNEDCTPRM